MARRKRRWQWLAPVGLLALLSLLALWTALDLVQPREQHEQHEEHEQHETKDEELEDLEDPREARAPNVPSAAPVTTAPVPAPAPVPVPVAWEFCAAQGEMCECAGRMRWGTTSKFKIFEASSDPRRCDFSVLGDPAPGDTSKTCQCEVMASAANMEWIYCASQYMLCDCPGRIRWGNKKRWKIFPNLKRTALSCSTDLGDPAPGDAGKHCQCEVDRSSAFYATISPAVKQAALEQPVVSCEVLRKVSTPWEQRLWEAVQGLCESGQGAGTQGMSASELQMMVKAWVSHGFEENYERHYKDGWLEEAFVNFIGSSPSAGKWALINEQLIRSVHLFSTRPVVVVHFGMATPREWDPKKYPRLVVLHAAPFPTDFFRRFDLNKYRSFLVARVKTGVQLDSDQFVAPSVDELFHLARREGSEQYPLPILPVHFLRNEELPMFPGVVTKQGITMSGGVSHVFDRYCREGHCNVTTRWGHAHPTWTYWALPFLGQWLRRHLRDETLPGPVVPLRVSDIDVDEDLLNVGTWEEGGHKQWCKYDVMDPIEFQRLLTARKGPCHPMGPPPIAEDPVFHPEGAPLVFYTAHHAVEPRVSARIIDELQKKKNDLVGSIFYKGCFYKDGASFKKAHPGVRCLI